MSEDFSPELRDELLTDFYSEADEHLNAIRDGLVALEHQVGRAQLDQVIVERLFRSFHSFKGISAIVGLKDAETLAHRAEDYLRDLSKSKITLTAEGLDALMATTQRLEQIVRAHREKQAAPLSAELLDRLAALTGSPSSPISHASSVSDLPSDARPTPATDGLVWVCTFSPAAELDARGVNVNTVRARLLKIGEIVRATPEVRPGGKVAFEFVVSLREAISDLDEWEKDGITFRPSDAPEDSVSDAALGPGQSAVDSGQRPSPLEQPAEHNPFVAPSHVVRVDLSRLDDLMRITGELVVHRSRFEQRLNKAARGNGALDGEEMGEINELFARSLRDLREAIMRVRLVPVAEIFSRMPFVVRDLAKESRKRIRLALSGQQTEIDKFLIERLKDPLLHVVRNCVSHGIETPEERVRAGKRAEATITLAASAAGDHVLIQVADDGRGVDVARVAERAAAQGLRVPETLDNAAVLNLLCEPGFSTRDEADRAAGRGVGMAVVNNTVRELGGALAMESQPGQGTRFTLRLPLTLAITEAFIVSAAEQTFAVPQTFVQEIVQMSVDQVHRVNRTEILPYREGVLPLLRLSNFIQATAPTPLREYVLVISSERGAVGLVVSEVHSKREVVVRSIRDPLVKVPGVAGATELGDGRPILILDAAALTEGVARPHRTAQQPATTSIAIAS